MNENQSYSVRRYMRIMVVIIVYKYELMDWKISENEVFDQDLFHDLFDYEKLNIKNTNQIYKEQLKIISLIEKNYEVFKFTIIKYIRNDWSWNRIDPLIRAILLCASVELWKLDIPIVSNEYIAITKDFIPNDKSYKFVNKIIENIGKKYYELKNKTN